MTFSSADVPLFERDVDFLAQMIVEYGAKEIWEQLRLQHAPQYNALLFHALEELPK